MWVLQKQQPEVSCKKMCSQKFHKFTGKHLCQSLFFNKKKFFNNKKIYIFYSLFNFVWFKVFNFHLVFIKKETLAQVFSSEFCEISKNTFSYRTPLVAVSEANNFNKYFSTITLDIHSSIRYIKRLLLSNIDKIPEKIMYNRLYIFLEIIELIQFGFRQKHSTTY